MVRPSVPQKPRDKNKHPQDCRWEYNNDHDRLFCVYNSEHRVILFVDKLLGEKALITLLGNQALVKGGAAYVSACTLSQFDGFE